MESILAIIVVILILVFISKVGSMIWRVLGIVILGALIWMFRDEILSQINSWFNMIESGNFWDSFKEWMMSIWNGLVQWFGGLAS
ncbi:hypothetical protein [Enterococcus olivae]